MRGTQDFVLLILLVFLLPVTVRAQTASELGNTGLWRVLTAASAVTDRAYSWPGPFFCHPFGAFYA